jgi:hypothetical protein
MKSIILLITLIFTVSCNHSSNKKEEIDPNIEKTPISQSEEKKDEKIVEKTNMENNEIPVIKGYSVLSKDIAVFRGILSTTKGYRPIVGDMILDNNFIEEKDTGKWKKKYKEMLNKKVEVKGRLNTYHCGSMEQCMTTGVIKSLRDIEYLILVKEDVK